MLAAKNMLDSLSREDGTENYKNNDYDFGEVLKLYNDEIVHSQEIRYSDGKKREFSFGN